jgi:hypothetical protein
MDASRRAGSGPESGIRKDTVGRIPKVSASRRRRAISPADGVSTVRTHSEYACAADRLRSHVRSRSAVVLTTGIASTALRTRRLALTAAPAACDGARRRAGGQWSSS